MISKFSKCKFLIFRPSILQFDWFHDAVGFVVHQVLLEEAFGLGASPSWSLYTHIFNRNIGVAVQCLLFLLLLFLLGSRRPSYFILFLFLVRILLLLGKNSGCFRVRLLLCFLFLCFLGGILIFGRCTTQLLNAGTC